MTIYRPLGWSSWPLGVDIDHFENHRFKPSISKDQGIDRDHSLSVATMEPIYCLMPTEIKDFRMSISVASDQSNIFQSRSKSSRGTSGTQFTSTATRNLAPGGGGSSPSKTYESNLIHHNLYNSEKKHSRYEAISSSSIVLSQQFCEAYFISLRGSEIVMRFDYQMLLKSSPALNWLAGSAPALHMYLLF